VVVDLHCHLLPDVDDGPPTIEEAVALARGLAAEGVRTAAATPHVRDDHPKVVYGELAQRCEALQARLEEEDIALDVVPGGELDLARALDTPDEELKLVSYGQRGTDLLLETPYSPLGSTFEELLFQVQVRGYRLLLAHPERNPTLQEDIARAGHLVERGVLLQLTASSFTRSPRKSRSSRAARAFLKSDLAHVIASDAHGSRHVRRSLSQGMETARKLAGARADWMANDAPAAILKGEKLPPPPGGHPAKRRWKRGLSRLTR
jgi:protein-tyrosine phosphatase